MKIRNLIAVIMIAVAATLAGTSSIQAKPTEQFQRVVVRAGVGAPARPVYRRHYYHRPYHRPYHRRVVYRRRMVRYHHRY